MATRACAAGLSHGQRLALPALAPLSSVITRAPRLALGGGPMVRRATRREVSTAKLWLTA